MTDTHDHHIDIDFETFYGKGYSLTTMPITLYVTDPRFEILCVSVGYRGERQAFTGTMGETKEWLEQYPWEESTCVAHNAMFEGSILEWRLGIKPRDYICTQALSNQFVRPFTGKSSLEVAGGYLALEEKGKELLKTKDKHRADFAKHEMRSLFNYCIKDGRICRGIADQLLPQTTPEDLRMVNLTMLKFIRPQLMLDAKLIDEEIKLVDIAEADALVTSPVSREVLMSNPQLADAMLAALSSAGRLDIPVPTKRSATTGKITWAFSKTDPEFLALRTCGVEAVERMVDARLTLKSTMTRTRLARFKQIHDSSLGGYIPFPLKYFGAHTGRLSGDDGYNMQNNTRGSMLRQSIVAPPGMSIVCGDLSQIEARLLANLAGEYQLLDAFAKGRDVYCEFASDIYGGKITKENAAERFVGKTGILGLGYGCGAAKFKGMLEVQGDIDVSQEFAQEVVDKYRLKYKKVKKLWRIADEMLRAMMSGSRISHAYLETANNRVLLPEGRVINYPNLNRDSEGDLWYGPSVHYEVDRQRKIYGASAVENWIQALAQLVIRNVELLVDRELYSAGIYAAGQAHDELIYVVPDEIAEAFAANLRVAMVIPPAWAPDLPLACEVGVGKTYNDVK